MLSDSGAEFQRYWKRLGKFKSGLLRAESNAHWSSCVMDARQYSVNTDDHRELQELP